MERTKIGAEWMVMFRGGLRRVILVMTLSFLLLALNISTVQAWNSGTHAWIMEQVPTILRNNGHDDYANVVGAYMVQLKQGAQDADGCAWNADGSKKRYDFKYHIPPWIDLKWKVWSYKEIGEDMPLWLKLVAGWLIKLAGWFGYSTYYATIDQFDSQGKLGIYCENLRTAGETAYDYYNLAVRKWNAGNGGEAMEWLGRASHMLQDVCTPFHATSDKGYFLGHPLFGKAYCDMCNWAETHQSEYAVNSGVAYGYPPNVNVTPLYGVKQNSIRALGYRGDVDGIPPDNIPRAVENLLPLAQRSTAEFIAFFLSKAPLLEELICNGSRNFRLSNKYPTKVFTVCNRYLENKERTSVTVNFDEVFPSPEYVSISARWKTNNIHDFNTLITIRFIGVNGGGTPQALEAPGDGPDIEIAKGSFWWKIYGH